MEHSPAGRGAAYVDVEEISPGVTGRSPLTSAPAPAKSPPGGGGAIYPSAPGAPVATTWMVLTPRGTSKVSSAPVGPEVGARGGACCGGTSPHRVCGARVVGDKDRPHRRYESDQRDKRPEKVARLSSHAGTGSTFQKKAEPARSRRVANERHSSMHRGKGYHPHELDSNFLSNFSELRKAEIDAGRESPKPKLHAGVKVRSEPVPSGQDRRRRGSLRGIIVSSACTNGGLAARPVGVGPEHRARGPSLSSVRGPAPMGSKGSAALLM